MPEVSSNTSPLQYLHQLGLLHILPALVGRIVVPPSVERELLIGRELGFNLPDLAKLDWVEIRRPTSRPALPFINDLGPGETETLMLASRCLDLLLSSTMALPGAWQRSWRSVSPERSACFSMPSRRGSCQPCARSWMSSRPYDSAYLLRLVRRFWNGPGRFDDALHYPHEHHSTNRGMKPV